MIDSDTICNIQSQPLVDIVLLGFHTVLKKVWFFLQLICDLTVKKEDVGFDCITAFTHESFYVLHEVEFSSTTNIESSGL